MIDRKHYKVLTLWIMAMSLLWLQGCNGVEMNANINEKITPPQNYRNPIRGLWCIEERLLSESGSNEGKEWIGKNIAFSETYALMGDEMCKTPEYKLKNVDAASYFLTAYKKQPEELGIAQGNIDVITVAAEGKFLCEFIPKDGREGIMYFANYFFAVRKQADTGLETFEFSGAQSIAKDKPMTMTGAVEGRSGVLLGLRSSGKKAYTHFVPQRQFFYRTLWIAAKDRQLYPLLEMPDLFLPRLTGFWKVGLEKKAEGTFSYDLLFSYPAGMKKEKLSPGMDRRDVPGDRTIRFLGNDYMMTEFFAGQESEVLSSRYEVFPIGALNGPALKVSDIFGTSAREAMLNALSSTAEAQKDRENLPETDIDWEENFTVVRRNGHWMLQGRRGQRNGENINYHINIPPIPGLANYDTLCISWNDIKNRVPGATDAFTSPNEDIAVIIGYKTLYIYGIENHLLSEKPMDKIPIGVGETVVMAEWATGDYVERWGNSFKADLNGITRTDNKK